MKAFEVTGIKKRFGGTVALDGASLACETGEIHGLIGENGAGKSTMIKIISGVYKTDAGTVTIMDEKVSLRNPWEGVEHGVVVVHQEFSLVPDLTVAENLFLPRPPVGKLGLIDMDDMEKEADHYFAKIGVKGIFPDEPVGAMTLRGRQILEIVKALYREPRILILDEPTSALSHEDVEWLADTVRRLRDQGVALVYISHRLGEIKDLCDRFTVLRNGKEVGTYRANEIDDDEVIRLMIGRSLASSFPARPPYREDLQAAIKVENLRSDTGLSGVDFTLRRSEVLGIAGLQGQGQRALFRCLFGVERLSRGVISVDGKPVRIRSPRDAIHAGMGFTIGLVPEERKTEGLFLDLPIRHNVTLPILDTLTHGGWIDNERERSGLEGIMKKVNIDLEVADAMVNSLSGGNQQKVVIAKWLLADCMNMLMYDPTRGVDVGTKFEIYSLIREMANSGKAVLIYSTELPELVNLCDRVLALYQGEITAEFKGEEITEEKLLAAIMGRNSVENASVGSGR
jgi:ribose transport system ATP-binding protein